MHFVAFVRFFIGSPLAARRDRDMTAEDFAGVAWQEIAGLETLGRLGSQAEFTEHRLASRGLDRTNFNRVSRRATIFSTDFEIRPGDLGQEAAWAASAARGDFAWRVEFPNTTGERLFTGQVGDLFETFGAADAQPRLALSVMVNSNVVRV